MTEPDPPTRSGGDNTLDRYARQTILPEIGKDGQRRLLSSSVVLIGCGALGTVLANTLVRAGVGHLRLCDRDFIEPNNLQRQILFDEDDITQHLPKVEAAARKLRRINSQVSVECEVVDVNHTNIERLCDGADLLLDGTDNFETRYLINDLAVQSARPWVYGAVIGVTGLCMPVIPNETACLRCVFEDPPPAGTSPTCDTAGVLAPAVNIVASFQATEAMKILMGKSDEITKRLISIDAWSGRVTQLDVSSTATNGSCPCCHQRRFDYLWGKIGSNAESLCGRDAVQILRTGSDAFDLNTVESTLRTVATGDVKRNDYLVRATVGQHDITVFADGRAIIKGTSDPDVAKSVYAKYIGS
jgi:molybdopterin-synthase adenylyltransferase